jgi:hypothetical protein
MRLPRLTPTLLPELLLTVDVGTVEVVLVTDAGVVVVPNSLKVVDAVAS